ncbi:MAG: DUF4258 domain-containing protein [Actinobacteria bacterium]|nr:DUF4258 domain-containing protein [Actinomycetota bacterium]
MHKIHLGAGKSCRSVDHFRVQIIFSRHCIQRMQERNVSLIQVEQVLASPQVIREGSSGSVVLESSLAPGSRLKVFVKGGYPLGSRVIIITVAWSER